MGSAPRIAIDAMGGDTGPAVMIAGAALAFERRDDLSFLLFGDEPSDPPPSWPATPRSPGSSEVVHCDDVISGDDRPSQAIRRAKTSSMGLAIAAVKEGDAQAARLRRQYRRADGDVQTGACAPCPASTGRRSPPCCRRSATTISSCSISAPIPNATPDNLVEFAVMGAAYARVVLELEQPRVQLLNIGTEELKGTDELKDAAAILRGSEHLHLRFDGFIEGDKLSRGDVDVVVTDGFSGNIALKSLEGTARFVTDLLRRAFTCSVRSKIGFLISRPATELLRHHLDPNNHNGAVFLGLNGLVVKSHGSATDKGVANAIRVAARMVREDLTRKITEDLANVSAQQRRAGGGEMSRRARIVGTGSALPPRRVTNAELAEPGRHHRRMDRRAHRHPSPPYRRRRRDHRDAGHRGGEQGARRGRDRRDRDRPDRARHRDSRPDLPGQRHARPDRARHRRLHRLRRAGGLHRLPLRALDRRQYDQGRHGRSCAGDRLGDVQPHPRLGGSRDLRPVRRRRRRGRAEGRGRRRHAASSPRASTPTAGTTICSMSTAASRPPARSASSG